MSILPPNFPSPRKIIFSCFFHKKCFITSKKIFCQHTCQWPLFWPHTSQSSQWLYHFQFRGTQIPGAWSPVRIIFFTEVSNIVSPIWNFLYITLLGPRMLKWFLEFKEEVPIVGSWNLLCSGIFSLLHFSLLLSFLTPSKVTVMSCLFTPWKRIGEKEYSSTHS